MTPSVEAVRSLLESHPYLWLFPLAVLEGPLVAMVAGSMVSLGLISWPLAYPLIIGADLVGDTFFYLLGRFGHLPLARRALNRIGVREPSLTKLEQIFRKKGARMLVGAKLTHFAGTPVLAAAGLARVNYERFLFWNLAATVPKSAATMVVGYLLGWQAVRYLDGGTALLLLIALSTIVCLAMWKWSTRTSPKEETHEDTDW